MLYALCDVVTPCNGDCTFAVDDADGYWMNEIDSETGIVYNYYTGSYNGWRELSPNELPDG